METQNSSTLRVPLADLAGRPVIQPATGPGPVVSPTKGRKMRRGIKRHTGATSKICEIVESFGELGLTADEVHKRARFSWPDITKNAVATALTSLRAQGKLHIDKKTHLWRPAKFGITVGKGVPNPPRTPRKLSKAPQPIQLPEVNEAALVVEKALKMVEDAANALKALGVSIVERANRIEQIKKDLSSV